MKHFILLLFTLLLGIPAFSQQLKATCMELNQLNNAITTGTINKQNAAIRFKQLIAALKTESPATDVQLWIFPLKGYTAGAIGGYKGNGYSAKGYHFLDGNKHAAHPAHDIFIKDNNQDQLDDRTHLPVSVVAIADGMVIACCNEWASNSKLRGGKYLLIYHPQLNMLSYYAHNRQLMVNVGDEVKGGQKIAEVGRTGFNAYRKRSPTHLHFSAFRLVNNLPVPFNCYQQLTLSQTL